MAETKPGSTLGVAVIANFAGSAWSAVAAIIFVPFYLRYLGAEGYGMVGFNTTLLSIVAFLDGGLTLTVNRELARLFHSPSNVNQIQETLSSGTVLFTLIAAIVSVSIWFAAPWIAIDWLNSSRLGTTEVVLTIRLIGLVVGEQMLVALFQGSLFGLHRQTTANVVLVGAVTVRSVGALLVLRLLSPTPAAFFIWYVLAFLLQLIAQRVALASCIGTSALVFVPNVRVIKALLRQTGGLGAVAVLALLLSQIDKVLVSRLLPLREFGYYMVGVSVSLLPIMIAAPFVNAVFPRFSRLAISNPRDARELLHLSTQLVTALVIPVGFTMAAFSHEIILAWTGSSDITGHVASIVSILVVGYAINASLQMCSYFEMAHARTRLIVIANAVALLVVIPGMITFGRHFGAPGIAMCWLLLNVSLLFISVPVVLSRGLRGELLRYYARSLLPPYAVTVPVVGLARLLIPRELSRTSGGIDAILVLTVAVMTCFLAIPSLRSLAIQRGASLYMSFIGNG